MEKWTEDAVSTWYALYEMPMALVASVEQWWDSVGKLVRGAHTLQLSYSYSFTTVICVFVGWPVKWLVSLTPHRENFRRKIYPWTTGIRASVSVNWW